MGVNLDRIRRTEALAKELQDLRQEAARGHLKTTAQAARICA